MSLCTRCAKVSNEFPLIFSWPNLLNSKHHSEAHRSLSKENRNLYCEYCGITFSTPAESTDHARSHRRYFCFDCGIEAYLPGREQPDQHSKVIGHDQNSVKANAKTPQTASPGIEVKKTFGHGPKWYNNPYNTQRCSIQADKNRSIEN